MKKIKLISSYLLSVLLQFPTFLQKLKSNLNFAKGVLEVSYINCSPCLFCITQLKDPGS